MMQEYTLEEKVRDGLAEDPNTALNPPTQTGGSG
jgi:hypothetical protein